MTEHELADEYCDLMRRIYELRIEMKSHAKKYGLKMLTTSDGERGVLVSTWLVKPEYSPVRLKGGKE
jgi:hypothetical protein